MLTITSLKYFEYIGFLLIFLSSCMLNYLKVSGGSSFYRGFNSLLSAPPFIIFNIKLVSMIVMFSLCYVC